MNKIYKAIIILLLPMVLLLTTLEVVSFNKDYFIKKYEEYNISKSTGISNKDLSDITEKLISYLKDDTDSLYIEAQINGELEEVFGEREVLHMVDVKDLFIKGRLIRNISTILIIASVIILIAREKNIGRTFLASVALNLSLILILFFIMYNNFDKYFTHFHELFFKNDLWLLNPKTDILIQILPLDFFYSIATKMSAIFISELSLLAVIGLIMNKSYKTSHTGE